MVFGILWSKGRENEQDENDANVGEAVQIL
jgi:hypothetical protein